MGGGLDTGFDEEPIEKDIRVILINCDYGGLELKALAHAVGQIKGTFGLSLKEAELCLIDLAAAFQPPKKDRFIDLYEDLYRLRLYLTPREDWPLILEDDSQTPVRPSRIRPRVNAIPCPPRVRRRMMDSRSGMKGRTTRGRMGK